MMLFGVLKRVDCKSIFTYATTLRNCSDSSDKFDNIDKSEGVNSFVASEMIGRQTDQRKPLRWAVLNYSPRKRIMNTGHDDGK